MSKVYSVSDSVSIYVTYDEDCDEWFARGYIYECGEGRMFSLSRALTYEGVYELVMEDLKDYLGGTEEYKQELSSWYSKNLGYKIPPKFAATGGATFSEGRYG